MLYILGFYFRLKNMDTNEKDTISPETSFTVIPCKQTDMFSQKCLTGTLLIDTLEASLGDAVEITFEDGVKCIGTIWPRPGLDPTLIQLDGCISKPIKGKLWNCPTDKNTSTSKLCVLNSKPAESVKVKVIVKDVSSVPVYKSSSQKRTGLSENVNSLLRKKHVAPDYICCCLQSQLGQLLGITHVVIDQISPPADCSIITFATNIYINSVQSKEKFEQMISTSNAPELGGLESPKQALRELLLLSYKKDDDLQELGVQIPRGILLRGPPGCGKTSLVHRVAAECEAHVVGVNGAEVFGARPGESEESLRALFDKAHLMSQEGPCILFVDEVDALCAHKNKGREKVVPYGSFY